MLGFSYPLRVGSLPKLSNWTLTGTCPLISSSKFLTSSLPSDEKLNETGLDGRGTTLGWGCGWITDVLWPS